MKTGIYYFSATGNSLTTAKLLAASLDGQCDVISLAALHNKQDIEVDYERVGFVFPIYYGDMPYLIRDTIRKMKFKQNTYIFIFKTYRGHPMYLIHISETTRLLSHSYADFCLK